LRKVEAIVARASLDRIRDLLARVGVAGMTITEVLDTRLPTELRLRVEIVLEDGRAPALVEEIVRATRTGRVGDGQIFVLPVEDAVRIRTDERGWDAL
jgi:nitrogen regulatory protein P-II 1